MSKARLEEIKKYAYLLDEAGKLPLKTNSFDVSISANKKITIDNKYTSRNSKLEDYISTYEYRRLMSSMLPRLAPDNIVNFVLENNPVEILDGKTLERASRIALTNWLDKNYVLAIKPFTSGYFSFYGCIFKFSSKKNKWTISNDFHLLVINKLEELKTKLDSR